VPGGYSYQRYWVNGEIEILDVCVLSVEFFNNEGDSIARVIRENIQEDALRALDAEANEIASYEVDNWNMLADDLSDCANEW
jgi:hypothetical protein